MVSRKRPLRKGLRLNTEHIVLLINELNWSQNEFAAELHIDRTSVNRWISGKRQESLGLMGAVVELFPEEPLDKLLLR